MPSRPRPRPLPNISPRNLFRIQECIPKSWRSRRRPSPTWTSPPAPQSHQLSSSLMASIESKSSLGHLAEAFTALSLLRLHRPTGSSFLLHPLSSLLSCSTSQRALPQGLQLHGLTMSLGFQDNSLLLPKLISFYASFGLLSDARFVAESSIGNRSLAWNMLIYAHARCRLWQDAILTYRRMVERGVNVDKFTYSSILRACGEIGDLRLGREIHRCLSKERVLELDMYVWNALVAMYAKCWAMDDAREVFDEMAVRDVVTWNSMISGYASIGMWEKVFEFLQLMPEALGLNTVTWNSIMSGNLRLGNYWGVLRLLSEMRADGSTFNQVTLVMCLKACSRVGSLRLGKEIHGLAIRLQWDGSDNMMNSLITMYCRCKTTNYAHILFRLSSLWNLVTWNAMISGFAHADKEVEAYLLFQEMIGAGIIPNDVTLITMISLCASTINLKHGQELHCYIIKKGLRYHQVISNALIAIYSKSGRIPIAQRLFDIMEDHDVVSYTSLISAYGVQGKGITSLKLFNEMISNGIEPDNIAMLAVLSACSHSKLIGEGQILFDNMTAFYGIIPQLGHFSCMVDLYCRGGFLRKAEEIINKMPHQPSAAMLATLIITCLVHGNLEIGLRAAKQLLELESKNLSHYVLISDMFAFAGCWSELAKVRTLMRKAEIMKAHSYLWLDLGNEICTFMAENQSSMHEDCTCILFSELVCHMRDAEHTSSDELDFYEVTS